MCVGWQVQILLRLYTSLLPNLRQAALRTAPSWAGAHTAAEPVPDTDSNHDALAATIRREAAAVLNVGRVFHSEGKHHACSSLCCSLLRVPECDADSKDAFPQAGPCVTGGCPQSTWADFASNHNCEHSVCQLCRQYGMSPLASEDDTSS